MKKNVVFLLLGLSLVLTGCSKEVKKPTTTTTEVVSESESESVVEETELELTNVSSNTYSKEGRLDSSELVMRSSVGDNIVSSDSDDLKSSVSVSASEFVTVVPDVGSVNLEIEVSDKEREKVEKDISEITEKVKESIIKNDIEEDKIKVSNNGINPDYSYLLGRTSITGYSSRTDIGLDNIPVEKLGSVISDAVNNGVTYVGYINYSYSGYDEAYDEALTKAVEKAISKANVIARASGKALINDYVISEGYQDLGMRYKSADMDYLNASEAAGDSDSGESYSVNISPGEMEITADVNLTCSMW